jgi:hypothetical protein
MKHVKVIGPLLVLVVFMVAGSVSATHPSSEIELAENGEIDESGEGRTMSGTELSTPVIWLPFVAKNWCPPGIGYTHVPPYASFEDLQGQVWCVEPTDYEVAVYISVASGWWTKPYWATPSTTIRPDGTWTCDVTTGGTDQLATEFASFLVPKGYAPPLMGGGQTLSEELFVNSVAHIIVHREQIFREIEFSGYVWRVKASETPAGPGPNYFSDRTQNVWVDGLGRLHLNIVQRNGRWYCSEVMTKESLGYGTYVFQIDTRVDLLDRNVVLGLFTWDDTAPEYNFREIDVEFSRWGVEGNKVGQYVVQPWSHSGNMHRFDVVLTDGAATSCFNWEASSVFFQSLYGHQTCPGSSQEIASWTYGGPDVPPEGGGNARINLWLLNGYPPTDGQPVEVIIKAFEFVS